MVFKIVISQGALHRSDPVEAVIRNQNSWTTVAPLRIDRRSG